MIYKRVGTHIGADDSELADFFGVTETTINNCKRAHIDFFEPIKKGKTITDANVVDRSHL